MTDSHTNEFGEEFDSDKMYLRWLISNDWASIDLGEV